MRKYVSYDKLANSPLLARMHRFNHNALRHEKCKCTRTSKCCFSASELFYQPRSQGFSPPKRGFPAHPLLGGEKPWERGWNFPMRKVTASFYIRLLHHAWLSHSSLSFHYVKFFFFLSFISVLHVFAVCYCIEEGFAQFKLRDANRLAKGCEF